MLVFDEDEVESEAEATAGAAAAKPLLLFLPKLAVVSESSLLTVAGLAPASTRSFSSPAAALAAAGAKSAVDAGAAGGGGGEGSTFSTNLVAASRLGCTAATSCESVAAAPLGSGAVPALKEMEAAGDPTLNSPVGEGEVWKTPASGTAEEVVVGAVVIEEPTAPAPAPPDADACCAAEGSAAKNVLTVLAACSA